MTSFTYSHKCFSRKRIFRVPFAEREKAAYFILRKKGLSYNKIAQCFGRSSSVVYNAITKVLRRNFGLTGYWNTKKRLGFDLRKLHRQARLRNSAFQRAKMLKLQSTWEAWVCGEEGKPP